MKKTSLFLVLILTFGASYGQNAIEYRIDKNIKITSIKLEINSSIIYTKNEKKQTGIKLLRLNDSISYLALHTMFILSYVTVSCDLQKQRNYQDCIDMQHKIRNQWYL